MNAPEKFQEWAIVEVMGHRRFIGLVSEQVIAGTGFVRIDIPASEGEPAWTKFVGSASIYAITPVSEEIARGIASQSNQVPVMAYDLPPRIEGPGGNPTGDENPW